MSSAEATEARLNIFLRLAGIVFIALGILLALFTSTTPLITQVAMVFYLISALLTLSGIIAVISKLE
ncbi:MAG: hypothetical protein ACE5KU_04040 [Nitrososphaerales archaeon]